MITLFPYIKATDKAHHVKIEKVIERIRTGGQHTKRKVEAIRAAQSKEERSELKMDLPAIIFQGKFSHRANDAMLEHSGFICLDFDNLGERMQMIWDMITSLPITYACFLSPSGNGLKVIVRIPPNILTHRQSARSLREYFAAEESYDHYEDEARVCYESYDPNIYHNPDSRVYTPLWTEPEPTYVIPVDTVSDFDEIYNNIKRWLAKKGEVYQDGNKYNYLVKITAACNRFGIDRYVANNKLLNDYLNAAGPVDVDDFKNIVNRVYNNYAHQFKKAAFDLKDNHIISTTEQSSDDVQQEILETNLRVGDVIYLKDIEGLMDHEFEHGSKLGETTYFPGIDEIWKWQRGELNVMNGLPGHGKTEVTMQLELIKSVFDGEKWAVFSPEQNPPIDFYNSLIRVLVGKGTMKGYSGQMTKAEYDEGKRFIKEHFFYLYPEKDSPTPKYINQRFEECIDKHGVTGCVIDPYNQMDHVWGTRDDQYISEFLRVQKRFALRHNVYMMINAHPTKITEKVIDPKVYNFGNLIRPNVYNLAGGSMWWNKCDNALCTYRPLFNTMNSDARVELYSDKIKKQPRNGRPGMVALQYDRYSGRYRDANGFNPLDMQMSLSRLIK